MPHRNGFSRGETGLISHAYRPDRARNLLEFFEDEIISLHLLPYETKNWTLCTTLDTDLKFCLKIILHSLQKSYASLFIAVLTFLVFQGKRSWPFPI